MRFRAAAKGRKLFLLAAACVLASLVVVPAAEASRSLPVALAPALEAPVAPAQVLAETPADPQARYRLFGDLSLPERPLELVEIQKTATGVSTCGLSLNIRQTGGLSRNCGGPSFQGLWTDPVTGIAYARNRWYDARNASWLSEDPLGAVDSPNLYAFVGWGPQSGRDPMGLAEVLSWEDWLAANPGGSVDQYSIYVDAQHDAALAVTNQPNWFQRQLGRAAVAGRWAEAKWRSLWDSSAGRATDEYKAVSSGWVRAHKADVEGETGVDPEIEVITGQRAPLSRAAESFNDAIETGASLNDQAADLTEQGAKLYIEGKALELAAASLIALRSSSTASTGRANALRGNAFEREVIEALGWSKNRDTYIGEVVQGSGVYRTTIPDIVSPGVFGVADMKNVRYASATKQLKAQAELAHYMGEPFNVVISHRTRKVSVPLQNAVIESGGKIYEFDPVSRSLRNVVFDLDHPNLVVR